MIDICANLIHSHIFKPPIYFSLPLFLFFSSQKRTVISPYAMLVKMVSSDKHKKEQSRSIKVKAKRWTGIKIDS
jgi:hypothetical protein